MLYFCKMFLNYLRENVMPLSQADIQGKYLKTITTACLDRYNTYFEDDVAYKGLKNRCGVIDDAIDLRFRENEAFISEIAPPVVRKDYYETNAFLQKYFTGLQYSFGSEYRRGYRTYLAKAKKISALDSIPKLEFVKM